MSPQLSKHFTVREPIGLSWTDIFEFFLVLVRVEILKISSISLVIARPWSEVEKNSVVVIRAIIFIFYGSDKRPHNWFWAVDP